ncbi:putative synaptobrevin protein [Erysiphe necator]|uniref:Putative synaptobrevin protein n=1 Tax=Uncinula necator TaxID=52586 RepID=A0A0B1P4K9_UNCNE|nr:putative synaptobrevin protein [Erysiphe necator]
MVKSTNQPLGKSYDVELPPIISTTALDIQRINLSRMISRFHQIFITPDSKTEALLRESKSERTKLESNLLYAEKLLAKLEQATPTNNGLNKKYDVQVELAQKRKALLKFSQQLKELNDLANYHDEGSDEDHLEECSLSDASCEQNLFTQNKAVEHESPVPSPNSNKNIMMAKTPANLDQSIINSPSETQSNLRVRVKSERAEIFQSSSRSTGADISSKAESLITHNRVEQEILTDSLLQMAKMLKNSSQAFSSALEEEKDILRHATQGLEKNELGLEAAQRRIGLLRTMTEGKGWWGRMIMYAWIFAMAVVALLIVLLMPKLRF